MEETSKNKPIIIFIIAAVALLLFVGGVAVIRVVGVNEGTLAPDARGGDNIVYKERAKNRDPYITVNPNLERQLAGPVISGKDPSRGNPEAKAVIVLFSDFECQFCRAQEEKIEQLFGNYENEIRLIWKDYPAKDVNSPSYRAAVAGRCAQAQGEFWPYHVLLYESQDGLDRDKFVKIAEEISMDQKQFKECLDNREVAALINSNIKEAEELNINGVPFVYINKQEIMGETSYEDLEKIVKIELDK